MVRGAVAVGHAVGDAIGGAIEDAVGGAVGDAVGVMRYPGLLLRH